MEETLNVARSNAALAERLPEAEAYA